MVFYLIFNALLYTAQVVLYALLFFGNDDDIFASDMHGLALIPGLIFYVLAGADLLLPLVIFIAWLYLTLSLSGFPFKSPRAQLRLRRVARVAMVWSCGRILYSIMILLTFTRGWFNAKEHNVTIQSMVLVAVFLVSELVPMYMALDSELLAMISTDDYQPLATQ